MKRVVCLLLVLCLLLTATVCFADETVQIKGSATINWAGEAVEHGNFTDLGDYVIDLGVITPEDLDKGTEIINSKVDPNPTACTAIAKLNSAGEVIMGRNMDLEVSNYPVFIAHYAGGKYQAVGFVYNNHGQYTYAEVQAMDNLPDGYREMQAAAAMDVFNEEGLYLQTNMRTGNGHTSSGTNPGGKRMNMGAINAVVAQNCATVEEALEFIKTELDVYSGGATKDGAARAGWDGAIMIGDATGEYGVIEFVNNVVYYTPYANGHGNAYVNPNLYIYNLYCAGFGRLALAQQAMIGAETADDMMEAIHKADWYHEILDIQYSYKDEQGNVHFVDKDGNPSIDYRSEMTMMLCIDDEGNYIPNSSPWIKYLTSIATGEAFSFLDSTLYDLYDYEYDYEELAELTGWEEYMETIFADSTSPVYEAEKEVLTMWSEGLEALAISSYETITDAELEALTAWVETLSEIDPGILEPLSEEYQQELTEWVGQMETFFSDTLEQYAAGEDPLTGWVEGMQTAALEVLERYHSNCTILWLTDNDNFDDVKAAYMEFFGGLNAFELLEKFFDGDTQPLRDSGEIFTTGMNFGVNCAQKYLKVRFLEDAECVYEYQW